MAQLELAIPYKSKVCSVGMFCTVALMPAWAALIPFALGYFTSSILRESSKFSGLEALFFYTLFLAIPAIGIILSAVFEDNLIVVSKEGLSFPLRMLVNLGFRRERLWSEINYAALSNPLSENDSDRLLTLGFSSGGDVRMKLSKMKRTDIEQLLLALEVWGKNLKRPPELIEFQNDLQNTNLGIEKLSYTQMWEEELGRRFSNTSFIPLKPNQKLMNDKLVIIRQLAFGGLSAIYLAQLNGSTLVVLKELVIPPNSGEAARAKAEEMFRREAKLLVKLKHPNIARVMDHFQENERNYLLLEYVRGQDLRQLVNQQGRQKEEDIARWALQIVDILKYLHSNDPPVIHRDLTPDNLVLNHKNDIVLIDFGAANEFVGTATGTFVGKQSYIAPEQLRGKATPKSDIYALGGTLYFLVTGRDPEALMASDPREARGEDAETDITSEEKDANESVTVSDTVAELIFSCTQMEESDRPGKLEDIENTLKALIPKKEEKERESG